MTIRELCKDAHANAVAHGFHDGMTMVCMLVNVHAEVSEAWECWRRNEMETVFGTAGGRNGKPEGFPSELADIMIRVADIAETLHIDLTEEIEIKMAYNETRPYRHGGKRA